MPRKLIMCGDHPILAFEYDPESDRACSMVSKCCNIHGRGYTVSHTQGRGSPYAMRCSPLAPTGVGGGPYPISSLI